MMWSTKKRCQVFYTTNSSLLLELDNLVAGGQLFNLTTEQVNRIHYLVAKLDIFHLNSTWQVDGETGLPSPKEAGKRETIVVRMDDFPKVVYMDIKAI